MKLLMGCVNRVLPISPMMPRSLPLPAGAEILVAREQEHEYYVGAINAVKC